eukprot:sb/3462670/
MVTDHFITTTTTPQISDETSERKSVCSPDDNENDEISPILASSPVPSETTEQPETLYVVTDEDISTDSDALMILEDSICLTFNQPAIPEETEEEEDEIPESSGEVPGLGIEEIYLAESSGEWANISTVEECVAVLDEDSICRTPDMSRSFCDDLPTSSRSRHVTPLTLDHRSTSLTTVNLPGLGEIHVRSKSEQCIHGDQRSTHHSLDKILPVTESSLPESFFSSTQDIGVFRSLENLQTPPRLKRLRKKRNSSSRHTHHSSSTSLDEDQAPSPRRRSHKKESPITQPVQMSTPTRDIVSLSYNLQQDEDSFDFSVLSNLSPLPSVVDRKKCSTPGRRRGSGTPTTLTPSTPKTRPEVLRLGDQMEGIYFTKSTRSVEKVSMKLDSVLFGGGGGDSSDSDGEMERFEREIVRESYAAVMDQLKVMVPLNTGEDDGVVGPPLPDLGCYRDDIGELSSAEITVKNGHEVLEIPDITPVTVTPDIADEGDLMLELDDNNAVSVSDILLGYDANTSLLEEQSAASSSQLVERDDGVERVGEIIQQQYFSQLMDEMRSWNPACELDGDPHPPTSTRARILSEPGSSSSSEPTINAFLRTLGGSDSEFSTPSTPCRFAAGLDPHPCSDSPFQKAQSLSVILKSPEIRKYQSKLRPCANPECGACQAKRKRKSERWKRWKILNQDQNPCQVD